MRTHLHLAGGFGRNYVKKYYIDTYLGLLWIPLIPVLDILMRTLFFGGFLRIPSGDRPYIVFLLMGSIGWYFYDRTTLWAYRALQFNRRALRTVPVPWLPAVTGAVVPGLLQGVLYGLIALVVCIYYRITQGSFYVSFELGSLWGAVGLGLLLLYAWTIGLIFAPVIRVIRDVRTVLRYAFAFWYLLTPVLYSVETIPKRYQAIAVYNPLTAPVELIRHAVFQTDLPTQRSVLTCLITLAVLLPAGLLLFARAERSAHAKL
ncbi:MAG TPA: ABC transporter permease [Plantibacter sp.]|uniref:ABC transporter permease n=1 Tax=Plantibacter sp. TaxID=1871045 RepID=UPI002C7D9EF2|nr:ABC transporter permease [Plantibacter sp.]